MSAFAAACLRFHFERGGISMTEYEKTMLVIAIIALALDLLTFLIK